MLFAVLNINAQIKNVPSVELKINYDKTLHLIFPNQIKYFNIGSTDIVGDKPEGVENILRLKANVAGFSGETNVSVVTADGRFFSYLVSYSENQEKTYLNISEQYKAPDVVEVTEKKDTHLIFSERIKYVDFGNNTIEVAKTEQADNIVRIQANKSNFKPTNVSVVTASNKFYTFDILYSKNPQMFSYLMGGKEKEVSDTTSVALFEQGTMNQNEQEKIANKAMKAPREIYALGAKKSGVTLEVTNIFIRKNMLLLKIVIKNKSSIDYDIDFTKFYVQDIVTSKKTASQPIDHEPLFMEGFKSKLLSKEKNAFVVALEKFTIPDNKNLIIEIQELNGGRHFQFSIINEDIINAQII